MIYFTNGHKIQKFDLNIVDFELAHAITLHYSQGNTMKYTTDSKTALNIILRD